MLSREGKHHNGWWLADVRWPVIVVEGVEFFSEWRCCAEFYAGPRSFRNWPRVAHTRDVARPFPQLGGLVPTRRPVTSS